MTPAQLSPIQVDALREVANIGSGYAATSLTQLSGRMIMIDVPAVSSATVTNVARRIAGSNSRVVAISMQMLGDLTGHTLFVLSEPEACLLCDMLLNRTPGESSIHGDMERSSLLEAGNIMAGSFLNAISGMLGKALLPSVPTVSIKHPDKVASSTCQKDEEVLVVETSFKFDESPGGELDVLTGVFLFVLDNEESINQLFSAIAV